MSSLELRPGEQLKGEILEAFWKEPTEGQAIFQHNEYFEQYFKEEHVALFNNGIGTDTFASKMAIKTHEDTIAVVKYLWQCKTKTKAEICNEVKENLFSSEIEEFEVEHAVDFALRLWLLVNIRGPNVRFYFGNRALEASWPKTSKIALEEFVASLFPPLNESFGDDKLHTPLSQGFTARNLDYVEGIQVEWTRNIEDHLVFEKDTRHGTLKIFPYRSCLEAQLKCDAPIPKAVLEDTILSLNVLFPDGDKPTKRFLERNGYPSLAGPYPRAAYIKDFKVWRRRMLNLYEHYQTQPGKLIADRRNPTQFWNFWGAMAVLVFTVAFGVISIVTACISTHYTILAYNLAVDAANNPTCCSPCPGSSRVNTPDGVAFRAQELRV